MTKPISGNLAAYLQHKSSSPSCKDQQPKLIASSSEPTVPAPGNDAEAHNPPLGKEPSNGSLQMVFNGMFGESSGAPVPEPLLNKRQLARHYGVCGRTIQRWVRNDMPFLSIGKRQKRFRLSQ